VLEELTGAPAEVGAQLADGIDQLEQAARSQPRISLLAVRQHSISSAGVGNSLVRPP
jgi:hypothetical protein